MSIWVVITTWPCFSLIPASKVLKEWSISCNSSNAVHDELAEVDVVSGLEALEDGWLEPLSDKVSNDDVELSVPLVLVLSALELPIDGEQGKDTKDSLGMVSESGCDLAGWGSLECLLDTPVCSVIGISRSGSVTSSLEFLLLFLVEVSHLGCLAGMVTVLPTGLSSNLVFLGYLLGWTLSGGTVSETKTWDVLVCLTFIHGSERTIFGPAVTSQLASCLFGCTPFRTEFLLVDGVFLSHGAEETKFSHKKESCIIGMSGLFGLICEQFLIRLSPVTSTHVS